MMVGSSHSTVSTDMNSVGSGSNDNTAVGIDSTDFKRAQSPGEEGDQSSTRETTPLSNKYISHLVETRDEYDILHYSRSADKHSINAGMSEARGPILEIVRTHFISSQATKDASKARKEDSLPHYSMRIYSKSIINALQSVVQYYPSQDLTGDKVTIKYPYAILVHHEEELRAFRERCRQDASEEHCARENNAYEHLGVPLDYMEESAMPAVREEKERNERGSETFEMRWVRRKPGTTLSSSIAGTRDIERAYVLQSCEGGSFSVPMTPWRIVGWSLDYDGQYAAGLGIRGLLTSLMVKQRLMRKSSIPLLKKVWRVQKR